MFFGPYIANCQAVVNFLADTNYSEFAKLRSPAVMINNFT